MKFLPDTLTVGGLAAACVGLYLVAGLGLAVLLAGIAGVVVGIALDRRAP